MWTALISGVVFIASLIFGTASTAANTANIVKVGLVDLGIERVDFSDLANVTVRTMTFWTSGTEEARKQDKAHKRNHGEDMVRTLVKNFRAIDPDTQIVVYVATPFRANPATGALMLDMDDLNFAYEWFAHEGVRVVGEMFVGPDSTDQKAAIRRASEKGLIVLASAGNGPSSNHVPPFPAAYDESISISTTALATELSREQNRDSYVDFSVAPKALSPIAYRNDPQTASLQGSSAATAAAAGILAALTTRATVKDRADAMMVLTCVARPTETFAAGRAWGEGVLVSSEIGAKLRAMGPGAHPCGNAA